MLKRGEYLGLFSRWRWHSWREVSAKMSCFANKSWGLDFFCFVSLFVCFFFGRLRLAVSMTDPKEFLSYDWFEEVNMLWWKMRRCRSVYWQLLFVISFSEGTMGNIVFRVNRSDDGHYISCSVNCQGIRLLLFGPILS